mmetsp:Transcript_47570/g.70805  ORF Transcript_47570/g.70805 Transcript_47570/m.70805 type:complete len:179 (-) Transcript_47570:216-752(-)
MVLNTSFNTLPNEPIVETPRDAIRSFLYSKGAIGILVMGQYVIRRKQLDLTKISGETYEESKQRIAAVRPRRAGAARFETSFSLDHGAEREENVVTRVQMPNRPTHGHKNEWFELLDELERDILSACDGSVRIQDIVDRHSDGPFVAHRNDEEEANEKALHNIVYRLMRLYDETLISW